MAAKTRSSYRCNKCGWTTAKWVGRCGASACGEWGTVEEVAGEATKAVGMKSSLTSGRVTKSAQRVGDIKADRTKHSPTGIGELDRVLGGGFVKGGVILLAGEPGVGKSTLLIEVADKAAKTGRTVLYASGEETAEQIKLRADRVGANSENLYITAETDSSVILGHIDEVQPDLIILDSLQTVASPEIDGGIGGVAQVKEVATILTRTAKQRGIPTVLVGQVTKENEIGGPRQLEHLVDVVVMFEGDKKSTLRMLRGIKNRYGAADEIGCFVHTSAGLEEVADPSGLFLGDRENPVSGTCVTVVVEGKRPLLAEVQSLVATSHLPNPRRDASGLDKGRLAMTQAVVERHGRVRLHDKDVYCSSVGGMKVSEPPADLAVALAIASAAQDVPLPIDLLALGEVALSGAVRPVHDIERRLAEAGRMGFKKALVPAGTADRVAGRSQKTGTGPKDAMAPTRVSGVLLIEVASVSDAVAAMASAGR